MLFDIAEKYKTNSDAPLITNDYRVLLTLDKEDILFCGENKSGQKIIGSICCEANDKPYTFRYVYIIVSEADFAAFTENRTTGYRELIESKATIFVLDKTVNDEFIQIYELPLSEMPKDYLPLPNFLCPIQWYENRKIEDMPDYVKWNEEIHKVSLWRVNKLSDHIGAPLYEFPNPSGGFLVSSAKAVTPATESEYNEFITRKKPLK